MMGTNLEDELIQALDKESELNDVNEYTPLDRLMYRSRSDAETEASLLNLLRASINDIIEKSMNPGALVNLLVGLRIKDGDIADQLEDGITADRFKNAGKRLAALTLLRSCDRVLPPRYIVVDHDIRALAPLQWLDLSLPVLPEPKARQEAILSLVESGALCPTEMHPRLHGIWTAGGSDPVAFLMDISKRMIGNHHHDFIELVKHGFGISLKSLAAKTSDEQSPVKGVRVPLRLKDRVAQVTKGDEVQLRVHKSKVRRSAIVHPFREFDQDNAAAA